MLSVRFGSKHPHLSRWLEITYTEDDSERFGHLIGDLTRAGWRTQPTAPPLGDVSEARLAKPGSSNFNAWTAPEKAVFIRQAVEVLARHGFTKVPYHKYSAQELE